MARPVGSKNKLNYSVVAEMCEARGLDLVGEMVEIYRRSHDDKVKVSILRDLMSYVYSKRLPTNESGQTEGEIRSHALMDDLERLIESTKSKPGA